jgi:hypothetical protein
MLYRANQISTLFIRLAPLFIALSFVAQVLIVAYVAFHSSPLAGEKLNYIPGTRPIIEWYRSAPFHILTHGFTVSRWIWPSFTLLGLIQSVVLYGMYRSIVRHGLSSNQRIVVALSAVVMAIAALTTPAMTSADPYAYIGYGLAPTFHDSLVTGDLRFPRSFEVINYMYGQPLIPNVYGPAFYLLVSFVRFLPLPLVADLYVLRVLGLIAFAGVVFLLSKSLPVSARTMLLLCPSPYFYWILDIHNDVFAVLCVAAALANMRKDLIAGVVWASVAPMLKIALLPVAVCIVAVRSSLVTRTTAAAAITALALLVLWSFDGRTVIQTILPHSGIKSSASSSLPTTQSMEPQIRDATNHSGLLRVTVLAAISLAVGAAVIFGLVSAGNSFLFAAFAPAVYPWYLLWGIPYAALTGEIFAFVPIALPALTTFENAQLPLFIAPQYFFWVLGLISAVAFISLRRFNYAFRAPAQAASRP